MAFLRKCQITLGEIPLSSRRLLRLDFGHGRPPRLRTAKLTHSASGMIAESSQSSEALLNGGAPERRCLDPVPPASHESGTSHEVAENGPNGRTAGTGLLCATDAMEP